MNSLQLLTSRVNGVFVSQKDPAKRVVENHDINLKSMSDDLVIEDDKDDVEVSKIKKFLILLFNLFIYFPNLLIFQPFLYIWNVITFPLQFLETKYQPHKDKDDNTVHKHIQLPEKARSLVRLGSISDDYDDLATISSITTNNSAVAAISQLKSPTSPSSYPSMFSKLPKVFFSPLNFNPSKHQKKTLILDLDETLIHSLSKTNRMSTAHMVEVKVNKDLATLYYVYKRPYCETFLRLVTSWFDVYIFTASAKEYADPVIDWLESDRKYFSKRYYRDNCTLRKGAGYIKDLSLLEIDLSKVILIDNSPISYSLNHENAIDIEGWIDDPTDNELLQLLPLLNSLRFVTDVRYILGMKAGEEAFR